MSMLSLQRGLDILSSFDTQDEFMTAQQLASRLEVPLSTIYRYLDILSERQYLTKNPNTKQYSLGAAVQRLAKLSGTELPVVSIATPFMEALNQITNETVYLTVLVNYRSVCVKKIESSRRVRLTIDEGIHQPLHAGASSRILLSYQTDRFLDHWLKSEGMPKLTDRTICDPNAMRQAVQKTREEGFTVSDGETDEGAMAIAAPVFDTAGDLRAGLSLAGPRERISSKLPELVNELKNSAAAISEKLGYVPVK